MPPPNQNQASFWQRCRDIPPKEHAMILFGGFLIAAGLAYFLYLVTGYLYCAAEPSAPSCISQKHFTS